MPLSRTAYKDALASTVQAGEAAAGLVASSRWQRLPSEIVAAKKVLRKLARVGLDAQDVLDQMEENDQPEGWVPFKAPVIAEGSFVRGQQPWNPVSYQERLDELERDGKRIQFPSEEKSDE